MGACKSPKGDQYGRGAGFWPLKRRPCSNTACMTAFLFWWALLFGQKKYWLSVLFFITPYFILLALSLACALGLHLEESCEVTWGQHASSRGGERRGASILRSCSACLGVLTRLTACFTRYKARFPYDRCWRKKKSVIIAIIWKPGLN